MPTLKPLKVRAWWALVHPDGRWWCEKPIASAGVANRTAKAWNSNLPRGERDRLRVAKIRVEEDPSTVPQKGRKR